MGLIQIGHPMKDEATDIVTRTMKKAMNWPRKQAKQGFDEHTRKLAFRT